MSNMKKSRFYLSNRGVFYLLLNFFTYFCYLRGTFLFSNQHQLFKMSLRYVCQVLNMGIYIMQGCIAVGVLRRKIVFGSCSFYPAFLFVLYLVFQMFVGICTSILITFKKSLKMLQSFSIILDFATYFFSIFTCWYYVVTLNSILDKKTQNISLYVTGT